MNQEIIESALKMLGPNESINRDVLQYVYAQGKVDGLLELQLKNPPLERVAA